jgi:uncharacterized protein (TIGR03118 family)
MNIDMRINVFNKTRIAKLPVLALAASVLLVPTVQARADEDRDGRYRQTNLVSDQAGVAMLQDTNLVNAWGISFAPTSPFWVSDNGSGLATLYSVTNDSSGMVHVTKRSLEVTIPGDGTPTGQLFNGTRAFHTNLFIFASEDGTISGWRQSLGTAAEVLVSRSTAVYKGITLASNSIGPVLLAANFREGTIDEYDGDLNLVHQFSDSHAPAGYAPFNVRNINGWVFVTFAKQDADKHDDVAGPGNGLIDIFNPMTGAIHRFATGRDAGGKLREINSPWGVAVAPSSFGKHGDQLLVGNFGSGTIMSFDDHGKFRGLLKGVDNHAVVIDGLWALTFGNGASAGSADTLFFSAGPDSEKHGLFGSLEPDGDDEDMDHDSGNGHGD